MKADLILDTCDLRCPMPVIKAKQALKKLQPGQVLQVITIDPSFGIDFQVLAAKNLCSILQSKIVDSKFYFWLQK